MEYVVAGDFIIRLIGRETNSELGRKVKEYYGKIFC